MTARLVLPPGMDRTPEWHEQRRHGVTASEVATTAGVGGFGDEFSLFWRKLGEIGDIEDSDVMSLGRHLESWVAAKFADDHPHLTLAPGGLYASVERPWQMATPDRLVFSAGADMPWESGYPVAVWEGKITFFSEGWGLSGTDEIPVYYRAQVLQQMDVMDVRRAYLSCLFMQSGQTRHYVIEYDPVDAEILRLSALAFIDRLTAGEPPSVDGSESARDALKQLWPAVAEDRIAVISQSLADSYRAACFALADAKEHRDELENQIRASVGAAQIVHDEHGRKVCTRSVYEVGPSVREGYIVDKLNPPRRPKKKGA